jgi:hypothetical protein
MKVKDIIEFLQSNHGSEEDIMINGDLYLQTERICGTDKVKNHPCGYWCCRKPGHDGDCYCSFKNMNYNNSESYDDDD